MGTNKVSIEAIVLEGDLLLDKYKVRGKSNKTEGGETQYVLILKLLFAKYRASSKYTFDHFKKIYKRVKRDLKKAEQKAREALENADGTQLEFKFKSK